MKIPLNITLTEVFNIASSIHRSLSYPPPSIGERLEELLFKIDNRVLQSFYIADIISSIIKDNLSQLRKCLGNECYNEFATSLIKSLLDSQKHIYEYAKNSPVYVPDLNEIWLACEPMLDLINGPDGWLPTLINTLLPSNINIKYFISNSEYYYDLLNILRSSNVSKDKLSLLHLITLDDPFDPPIAIHISPNRIIGLRGRWHPKIAKNSHGNYALERPLPPGWISTLSSQQTNRYYSKLNQLIGGI